MGSKSKICEEICKRLPPAENFYDVFGGGFSITHFMLERRKSAYKNFYFNEIRKDVVRLIQDAIAGKYNYDVFKPEWISRERFFREKESDAYIKIIWSFGNYGETYLFGESIEKQKRSLHQAIVFSEFDDYAKEVLGLEKFKEDYPIKERRLYLKNRLKVLEKDRCDLERLERLERLQQLEQLEQLERLQQLQRLPSVNFTSKSYEELEIKKNSTIYCDPPYLGTATYDKKDFNHKAFYDWADSIKEPVFISEYSVPDNRFKNVFNIEKRSMLSADKTVGNKVERLFANKTGYEKLMDLRNKSLLKKK
jgi:site-specific DNA-adenine methylase